MSWVGATAAEIAYAVRRGDVTATEVVDQHLTYITEVDRRLGAFRVVRRVEARAEAAAVEGLPDLGGLPLAGVPVAVKENVPIVGERTQHGSAATLMPVADADHEVVRRLRGAGAVVIGQTRMPELGIFATTDDQDVVTRNPWQLDRTAGGSSGGSAAAVAAGMVPLAVGNDGLGSIRIPAACCGLVGLKPGRGAVPAELGANWFGLVENGVLACTVTDAACGYAVLAGQRPEPVVAPPPTTRFAVSVRSPVLGVTADRDARDALRRIARELVGAGHSVRRADPPYPLRLGAVDLAHWVAGPYLDAAPFEHAALQPRTRRHVAAGRIAYERGLVRERDREHMRHRCLRWFTEGGYDVLLTPVLATTPPRAAHWSHRSWLANAWTSVRYAPYPSAWNIAGFPAMAVPAGLRGDGMPAAVQLVGPPASEPLLLSVAAQLETAQPWQRHPTGWPRGG